MIGTDYAYLEARSDLPEGAASSPILVSRRSSSGRTTSDVLPCKGTGHPYCVELLVSVLLTHMLSRFALKSDGEPAIVDLKTKAAKLARERHGFVIALQESPVGDSASSGLAEGGVRGAKAAARTVKLAVEQLHDVRLDEIHTLLPWLVAYGSEMRNIGRKGPDGFTPHQRLRGKSYLRSLPPFSEKVQFMLAEKQARRISDRWASESS